MTIFKDQRINVAGAFLAVVLALGLAGASLAITGAPATYADEKLQVPEDFGTIQEAVNAANPGDTIEVDEGTYTENVLITKAIRLEGDEAVLDGAGLGGIGIHVMNTSGVEISGFIVEKFDTGILFENVYHSAVDDVETRFNVDPDSPRSDAINFQNGLDLVNSDYNHITEVFAHHNGHNGITLKGGSNNNTLDDNTTNDNGIHPLILASPAGCGIQISRGGTTGNNNNTVTDNESLRNAFGILVSGSRNAFPGSTGNFIEDNDVHGNARSGIDVRNGSSDNVIVDNDATGNGDGGSPNIDLNDQGALDNTWEDNEGESNF